MTGGLLSVPAAAHIAPPAAAAAAGVEKDAWARRLGRTASHPGKFAGHQRVGGALHHGNDERRERIARRNEGAME